MRFLTLSSLIHAGLIGLVLISGWHVISAGGDRSQVVSLTPTQPWTDPFETPPEPERSPAPLEEDDEPEIVQPRFAERYYERPEEEAELVSPHPGPGFFLDPVLDHIAPVTAVTPEPAVATPTQPRPTPERPEAGPLVVEPILLEAPEPNYPRASIRRSEEGRVLCRLHIDARGVVMRVDVVASSGFTRLDDAAVAGLSKWRFQPRTEDGAAVPATLIHPVSFRLWDS